MTGHRGGQLFGNQHIREDLKKKAIRGAGATLFSQGAVFILQIGSTIVLARLLTPEDFGLVAMVTAFSLLLQNFGINGFTEAVIQEKEVTHEQISTLFWISLAISIALGIIFMLFSPLLALFYDDPRLIGICLPISLSFVFTGISTLHLALLKRNMLFYRVTLNEVIAHLFTAVIAILGAWAGLGYWALVMRRVAPFVFMAAGGWVLCRWIPGPFRKSSGVGPMIRFAMHTYGNFSLNYFSRNLDKVLVGWRFGAKSLGSYNNAYYLFVMPVSQLTVPLTGVVIATLSRLRDDPERYFRYYQKAFALIAFVGMPISAILTITGKDVILLLLGPQWEQAGEIFMAFGPCVGVLLLYSTHGWLHLSLGHADRWLRWSVIGFLVTGLLFAAGLSFGPMGVALAYMISFFILILPGIKYAGSPIGLKVKPLILSVWRFTLAAFISGLAIWYFMVLHEQTSLFFTGLPLVFRIVLPSVSCTLLYLFLTIILHGGTGPIKEFLSISGEMLPERMLRLLRLRPE